MELILNTWLTAKDTSIRFKGLLIIYGSIQFYSIFHALFTEGIYQRRY